MVYSASAGTELRLKLSLNLTAGNIDDVQLNC